MNFARFNQSRHDRIYVSANSHSPDFLTFMLFYFYSCLFTFLTLKNERKPDETLEVRAQMSISTKIRKYQLFVYIQIFDEVSRLKLIQKLETAKSGHRNIKSLTEAEDENLKDRK